MDAARRRHPCVLRRDARVSSREPRTCSGACTDRSTAVTTKRACCSSSAAMISLIAFTLLTRMHERYMFPVLALPRAARDLARVPLGVRGRCRCCSSLNLWYPFAVYNRGWFVSTFNSSRCSTGCSATSTRPTPGRRRCGRCSWSLACVVLVARGLPVDRTRRRHRRRPRRWPSRLDADVDAPDASRARRPNRSLPATRSRFDLTRTGCSRSPSREPEPEPTSPTPAVVAAAPARLVRRRVRVQSRDPALGDHAREQPQRQRVPHGDGALGRSSDR